MDLDLLASKRVSFSLLDPGLCFEDASLSLWDEIDVSNLEQSSVLVLVNARRFDFIPQCLLLYLVSLKSEDGFTVN